jgi:hypothetical protein
VTDSVKQPNTKTLSVNWGAEVKKALGAEYSRPDIAYEFSNGRKFNSTDQSDHGVYEHS